MLNTLEESVAGFLKNLGITTRKNHETIEELITEKLKESKIDAVVIGLRYKTLTLQAEPIAAQLLSYMKRQLLDTLEKNAPGEVENITVYVKRKK